MTGQELSSNVAIESSDSLICTSPTSEIATNIGKSETNTAGTAAKKKKRKRSKKGRN